MKIGLQLFSIRELMKQDMELALKTVSEAGYEYVEFAGFFGRSAQEVNELLAKYSLKPISVHAGLYPMLNNEDNVLEYYHELGLKYAAVPYLGLECHKCGEKFDETMNDLIKLSALLRAYDITLLYHNHEFEFGTYEGKYLNDWLIDTVGIRSIMPQADLGWVTYGGADPVEYILKYSNHMPLVHLKDFTGNIDPTRTFEENNYRMVPLGEGCQDWDRIFDVLERSGCECMIVEQDDHYDTDPVENIIKSRKFLTECGY